MMKPTDPKPGTEAAKKLGCTCTIIDNYYGLGRHGDGLRFGWNVAYGCPLHAPKPRKE